MPPSKKFSREHVADTAFELVRRTGWPGLSARSIAKELASSTMPIYSNLSSMEEIEDEVRRRALDLLLEHQTKQYTENPFLNLAVGYIAFARSETNLFRFLFLERPRPLSGEDGAHLREKMSRVPDAARAFDLYFSRVSAETLDEVTRKSWIFAHGLAMAMSNGLLGSLSDEEIVNLLSEAGAAFVKWHRKDGA